MRSGHQAERQCLLCRQSLQKTEMLRLAMDPEGNIWPDWLQKAPGRGSYLCMQEDCLGQLQDKRLGVLKRHGPLQLPQADTLRQRMRDGIIALLRKDLGREKSHAAVGRDAVMHQMWKNAPLLVLLAADAGDALVRQILDAVAKREAGEASRPGETTVLRVFDTQDLALFFDREKVAVAALADHGQLTRLMQISAWYGRLNGPR